MYIMKILYIFLPILIIISIFVGLFFFIYENETDNQILGEVHEHADFKLYILNEEYNFSQEKYMSDEKIKNNFIHLHDMDGDLIHSHIKGNTLEFFFFSIGIKFNSTCLILDNKSSYCNDKNNKLKVFVNDNEDKLMEKYILNDLDKILITYNDKNNNINEELKYITDKACIQSGKCPERGEPNIESSCTSDGCKVIENG